MVRRLHDCLDRLTNIIIAYHQLQGISRIDVALRLGHRCGKQANVLVYMKPDIAVLQATLQIRRQ